MEIRKQLFDEYFSEIYTKERWMNSLYKALEAPTRYACLINYFADPSDVLAALKKFEDHDRYTQVEFVSIPCLYYPEVTKELVFPSPQKDIMNLSTYYLLDAASVMMTEVLNVNNCRLRVLDMCAAPGGKSLSIAQRLFKGENGGGKLVCNEFNSERRKRLSNVLRSHLPKTVMDENVEICGYDGTRFGTVYCGGQFDRVMVDAPCSSERHLIHQQVFDWSVTKSRNMALKQFQLLLEAFKVVKPGGFVLYGTCSLSREENDDVVDRALKKSQVTMKCLSRKWGKLEGKRRFPIGEPTDNGWIVLPDSQDCGWGPLYFALMKRME